MSQLPGLLSEGRLRGVAVLASLAVGQAAAAGAAAFAMRDVFAAFKTAPAAPPVGALLLVVAAGLTIAGLRVAERAVAEGIGQGYAASLRKTLFGHLTRMPAREVSRRRTGALAIRFIGDLTAVRAWVSLGIGRMISAAFVLPGALIALVLLNPLLAAAAIPPLALAVLLMALLAPRLGPLHRCLRSRRARIAADMSERIPVAPELRLLGRDEKELDRLDRSAQSVREAAIARARASATLQAIPDAGSALAGALLLLTALGIGAAPADAAAALAVLGIVALPLRDLAGTWDRRRAWEVARDKCRGLLDAPVLEATEDVGIEPRPAPARLDFEQVSAGVLRNLCGSVMPGEKICIVGGNGTGKSTLLALAAGLEHGDSGRVQLDGTDMRAIPQAMRSEAVTLMGARSPILKGSLRRALTLGVDPRPGDAAIEAAALAFGLGGVLDRLGGLDAKVAEGGRNLSSGESRRVHLVRAVLSRPRLLLLDEPDDALDAAGRRLVAKLLGETDATTLIVTHDLALARASDTIWYVEGGVVRESGPPGCVLDQDGPTARFFRPSRAA